LVIRYATERNYRDLFFAILTGETLIYRERRKKMKMKDEQGKAI
jgi:hypothetical protein